MSGYRSLHREKIEETAIWSVAVVECKTGYKIFTASSNGRLNVYQASENSSNNKTQQDMLDASALRVEKIYHLGDENSSSLGCTQVSIARNYAGEDDAAGDLVVLSLNMAGTVRLWSFPEDWIHKVESIETQQKIDPKLEFTVSNATGTTASLAPPRIICSYEEIVVAVGCLDGTVSILSTGLPAPNAKKGPSEAGTVLDSWGSQGSATPLSLHWNSLLKETLAVGRQDGVVDILSSNKKNLHRLLHMNGYPVRAVQYTPDVNLLIAGNDNGMLCIWDVNRSTPTLVHHVMNAHASWILDVSVLADSRRFLTVGADQQIHVWHVGQIGQNQPLHSFRLDSTVWSCCILESKKQNVSRLVTGSETGWTYVYSLES